MKKKNAEDKAEGGIAYWFERRYEQKNVLKIIRWCLSIPIVGKILKPFKVGKKVTQVPIIKTDDVAGKPEWFDQLVNKVILEGDDVTKRFATKDREIVHMKKIDDDNTVMVYQDLDEGAVRVDYDAPSYIEYRRHCISYNIKSHYLMKEIQDQKLSLKHCRVRTKICRWT